MAVRIRLMRMGSKRRPFYRFVVADSRGKRDGGFLDQVGYYNPIEQPQKIEVDEAKVFDWLMKGAQLSDGARSLLKKTGTLARWDAKRTGREAPLKSLPTEEVRAAAAPSEEVAPEEAVADKAPQEEAAPAHAVAEEGVGKEKPAEAAPAKEPPAEEVAAESASTEKAVAEEKPAVEEASGGEKTEDSKETDSK
jgi:small subunit ribosomal protein S16